MNILIIGSGISGLCAAIEAASLGNQVILASPYPSERSQSVMAAGGINGVDLYSKEQDSPKQHAYDTLKGGCFLENSQDVQAFCEHAIENLSWLEAMGVVFNRDESGRISRRAFGGQSRKRTAYAGSSTGKQIVTALVQKCREYEIRGLIERRYGLFFHSALIWEGRCFGAILMHPLTGQCEAVYADALIMATGGQNKLFGKTTGSELCDGYAAGKLFTQGVHLKNLEFIQYHPTTIETSHKRMLITEAARGEGGRLYYKKDKERCYFMEELYGENGNLMPRDIVSRCMYECHSQVYLDISFLGEKLILERLREPYELCRDYLNLDVTRESIPVSPSIHFFMGGIYVDAQHETNISGLYAVGECASKYHGANRLGGNSLMAAVYSGRTAAQAITEKYELRISDQMDTLFVNVLRESRHQVDVLKASKSLYPVAYMQRDLAQVMNEKLGIARCRNDLLSGIEAVDYYLKVLESLHFDPSVSLYENYRIYYMSILSKAVLMSALEREETRGSHIRTDFPETRREFQKCSIAEYKEHTIHISYKDEVEHEN